MMTTTENLPTRSRRTSTPSGSDAGARYRRAGGRAGLATPSGTAPAGAGAAAAGPGTTSLGLGYHPGGVGLP